MITFIRTCPRCAEEFLSNDALLVDICDTCYVQIDSDFDWQAEYHHV